MATRTNARIVQSTAIAQSTVMAEREQQAATERDLENRVQGWLLYRALKPQEFGERVVELFVGKAKGIYTNFQNRK
jgi:hypothetical protein